MAVGAAAVAVALAAFVDLRALAAHAGAGPRQFAGARCAGTPDPAAAPPGDPAVGLAAWTSFEGVPTHNPALPAIAGAGSPLAASWTFATNGPVVTPPAVVAGVAYLGSMDGCVYAVNAATGRLIWSFAAANQVMSEPLVVGGRVYFGAGNKEMTVTAAGTVRGSGQSGLYALDARTGRELWMFPTPGEDMPTPAYRDGVLYEATGDKTFYAVSAATGQLLWKVPLGSYVSMSSPTLSGDIAVFGGAQPYALFGVNVATHTLAWRLPLPAAESGVDDGTPAVAGGVAYVQVPEGHYIKRIVEMAVRARDGRVLWTRTLGVDPWDVVQRALWEGDLRGYDGEEVGLATVAGGRLYVGSPALDGLWALDARTGAPVWHAALGAGVRAAPVVGAGRVYAVSNTALFVIDARSGRLLARRHLGTWRMESGIDIPCATPGPVLAGGTLLVGAGLDASQVEALPLAALTGGRP